jgi:hypothetical protein
VAYFLRCLRRIVGRRLEEVPVSRSAALLLKLNLSHGRSGCADRRNPHGGPGQVNGVGRVQDHADATGNPGRPARPAAWWW